jgi:hypothetical protein
MAFILSLRVVAIVFLVGLAAGLWNGLTSHAVCGPERAVTHGVPGAVERL